MDNQMLGGFDMKRKRVSAFGLAMTVAACGVDDYDQWATTDAVGSAAQEIINGTAVPVAQRHDWGVVRLSSGCTGTLLTNYTVLTARHCVPVATATLPSNGTIGIQTVAVARSASKSDSDVAVVFLQAPFNVDGSTSGYRRRIFAGDPSGLQGRRLHCQGYGRNTYGGGFGTLRWANLDVDAADDDFIEYVPTGSADQIQWRGDSGGTCFFNGQITGVNSTASHDSANRVVTRATQVSPRDYRGWARSVMGPYKDFSLQTGTALHETGENFDFVLAGNRDLFAIKKSSTGTGSTEVHVLSAASGYRRFSLHTGTALHETGANFDFVLAGNRDLFAIKKSNTGTNSTEVHVLSAASGYRQFSLHTGTALHETGANFDFGLAGNRDLFAIKKSNTGTGSTEVHVLSAASGYRQFSLQTGTVLHETDGSFDFALAGNRDLFAIKKNGTGTNSTEVHVLSH
jgi:hypothetical protein